MSTVLVTKCPVAQLFYQPSARPFRSAPFRPPTPPRDRPGSGGSGRRGRICRIQLLATASGHPGYGVRPVKIQTQPKQKSTRANTIPWMSEGRSEKRICKSRPKPPAPAASRPSAFKKTLTWQRNGDIIKQRHGRRSFFYA